MCNAVFNCTTLKKQNELKQDIIRLTIYYIYIFVWLRRTKHLEWTKVSRGRIQRLRKQILGETSEYIQSWLYETKRQECIRCEMYFDKMRYPNSETELSINIWTEILNKLMILIDIGHVMLVCKTWHEIVQPRYNKEVIHTQKMMTYVTYHEYITPAIRIYCISCRQVKNCGGWHKTNTHEHPNICKDCINECNQCGESISYMRDERKWE